MSKPTLTDEQQQYLVAQYVRGRSTYAIGQELNLNAVTVLNYLKKHGVERRKACRPTLTTPELIDLALKMRAEGKPWKQVSAHIGITTNTLLLHIRRQRNAN